MIIKFARRYGVVAVLSMLAISGIVLVHHRGKNDNSASMSPAQVIIRQVAVIDQGVQVEWLPGQQGTYPISGYVIERSRGGGAFVRIARAEKASVRYLDSEGRQGDAYRVIAEDNRQPAGRSAASEHIIAAPAKPGAMVVTAAQGVLGASKIVNQADTPDIRVVALQEQLTQAFAGFDAALTDKNLALARGYLIALQDYQRQILSLWPQISVTQKVAAAKACTDQQVIFEANLYMLTERDHLDGMLVLAGCSAIQEGAS